MGVTSDLIGWENTEEFINRMFNPWNRLTDKIHAKLARIRDVNEHVLTEICQQSSKDPEYAPFLEKEMKDFVAKYCVEFGLDYMEMPEDLRTKEMEKHFQNELPYLLKSEERNLLSAAYNIGFKTQMTLKEPESFDNGYIGGNITWDKYTPLKHPSGPFLDDKRMTGIGQIDYKDCTNVYVIYGDNEKARLFDGLNQNKKTTVLEAIYLKCKNNKTIQQKNNNTRHI